MSMSRYIAVRLAVVIPVLLLLLVLTFLLTHVLPTNPAVLAAGPDPTPKRIAEASRSFGLNRPILSQLLTYLGHLAHGDLGRSIQSNNPVIDDMGKRILPTLLLITLSVMFSFAIALSMAIWTAGRERGPVALAGRLFGGFGSAMPDYFLGIVLILIFYVALSVAPSPLGQAGATGSNVPSVTGAYLIDAIIAGNLGAVGSALGHLVLPVATLSLATTAAIYRVAKSAIEDANRARYVDYAALMGCSSSYIRKRVLQNAAPPVLTMTGVIYGLLLGGAVIVETVFAWGGVGQYAVTAITSNDFNATQGFVLVAAVFSVLVYLAVDIVHALLDPRVRSVI